MTETEKPPVKYGAFNNRVLAATIDMAIIMLVAEPVSQWATERLYEPVDVQDLVSAPSPWHYLSGQNFFIHTALSQAIQLIFIALYTLPFWFRYSTTPGKMLFRMEILDAETGMRMTRRRSAIRFAGYLVSGGAGFVVALMAVIIVCYLVLAVAPDLQPALIAIMAFLLFSVISTLGFIWILFDKKRRGWHDLIARTNVVVKPRKS